MTNESISGFLNSIAEAKRAFDAEPDYQRQIRDLESEKHRMGETIAARELRIHSLKQDNDSLLQKLRSVEAERDDAGFRAIQETDKVQNLLTLVHGVINDALKAVSAVEGLEKVVVTKDELSRWDNDLAKARKDNDNLTFEVAFRDEEIKQLQDEMAKAQEQLTRPLAGTTTMPSIPSSEGSNSHAAPVEGQSEMIPTASASDPIPQGLGNEHPVTQEQTSFNHAPEGQSEGPFATTPLTTQSQDARSAIAEPSIDAVLSASPPERNRDRSTFFKGRKYFDITYFVPLHQWLNEGGSREDYYWRPAEANVPLPEANRASHNS